VSAALRFGILGTGSIASEVAYALTLSERCEAFSVASRDPDRARAFADRHGVVRAAASYRELLDDPGVDVVYVAVPHSEHERWTMAAIEAGKHVLCEKPITIDASAAERVFSAAEQAGVFVLEAFAYWFHPQTDLLMSLVRERAVGELRMVEVTFSYGGRSPSAYHLCKELGGGGILDVGCYCTSMAARLVAGAAGESTAEPLDVVGLAVFDPTSGTDTYAIGAMRFGGEVLAKLLCGVTVAQPDLVRVTGTDGYVETTSPAWLEGHRSSATWLEVHRSGEPVERRTLPGGTHIFTREVDSFAALLEAGAVARSQTVAESLANMRTLDRWRRAVGLRYSTDGRYVAENVLLCP
jgi:predicted dehydrogenase